MRKTVITPEAGEAKKASLSKGLDVAELARVEVSSEDPQFPVENVFSNEPGEGWRAATSGEQTLRLLFDEPLSVRRIDLAFQETKVTRTQEIALRWKGSEGSWREIVRQQWNFSPSGSTSQVESWQVQLDGLSELELKIRPEIGGGAAVASLRQWSVS